MKISILNGNPNSQNLGLENFISSLDEGLVISEHSIEKHVLRDLSIRYCKGCFNCWLKTPGECSYSDDSQLIRRSFIKSDLVLFISPIIMGSTSALLKKAIDKLIPLLHPYFEFSGLEVHHKKRYSKYPKIGVILENSDEVDKEDLDINKEIFLRNALNLKTSLIFLLTTSNTIKEILYEINSI